VTLRCSETRFTTEPDAALLNCGERAWQALFPPGDCEAQSPSQDLEALSQLPDREGLVPPPDREALSGPTAGSFNDSHTQLAPTYEHVMAILGI
jgi:hypothetical protein